MLAEIFAILAGHESSLFTRPISSSPGITLTPSFAPLLHPGERSAILSLAHIASLYSSVRHFSHSPPPSYKTNEYVFALCSAIRTELAEYEALVVQTERDVLAKDESLVGAGSFVPLSSLLAIFSEWEPPLAALDSLVTQVKGGPPNSAPSGTGPRATDWPAGQLIDLVHRKSLTGYTRVSAVFLRLLSKLQRILLHHLTAYLLHGVPLSSSAIPACISPDTRESITYVGQAVATVMKESWQSRLPRDMVQEWTKRLAQADMFETQRMDRLIADLRTDVSEWLWTNILRKEDIAVAVDALADYFLLRNGEFASSFIREVERLKRDRLKSRTPLIRAQDLDHALLRSSLGTAAESDAALTRLGFVLPSGPVRPFLSVPSSNLNQSTSFRAAAPDFSSLLLGTPAHLTYSLAFPLSLFLTASSLQTYAHIHTYFLSLRRSHLLLCDLWSSLSLSQRKRRRWVRLGEGGEGGAEGEEGRRRRLLRRTWGCVREMVWFLESMLGYLAGDVVEVGYKAFRDRLGPDVAKTTELATSRTTRARSIVQTPRTSRPPTPSAQAPPLIQPKPKLDFTTLRSLHASYLASLLTSSLLASLPLSTCVYDIVQLCERLVGQVERWGGDVLPELLGGAEGGTNSVDEREVVVDDIYETFTDHLRTFYSLLATSPLLPPPSGSAQPSADASTFLNHSSILNTSSVYALNGAGGASSVQARRQVEHLMLKMDFNGVFSGGMMEERGGRGEILKGLSGAE